MTRVIAFIRSEPVVISSVLAALVSIAVAFGIGQPEAGGIAAAVTVILGVVARTQVTPTTSTPATSPAPSTIVTSPPVV